MIIKKTFGKYSKYYDVIYKDKNYPAEVRFIEKIIHKYSSRKVKSILSLGCGSGNHEVLLAKKGYKILGIDRSKVMLELFNDKAKKLYLLNSVSTKEADVSRFRTAQQYDCAISMFNVVGYQTENEQFDNMLKNVNKSLKTGGLFMFDCWHNPAVLKDKPTDRIKEIVVGNKQIIRLTSSKLNIVKNIIEITFKVLEIVGPTVVDTVTETHPMRYWTIPELTYFLEKGGFELVSTCNFLDLNSRVSDDKWDIFILAKKIK